MSGHHPWHGIFWNRAAHGLVDLVVSTLADAPPCRQDGMTSSGVDYGLCGLPEAAHVGVCPECGGSGEYETEYGPRGCMACLTGLGPYGHAFKGETA